MAEGRNGNKDDSEEVSTNHKVGCNYLVNEAEKSKKFRANIPNGNMEEKVCRDFLRKVCHRGNRCKFLHPENEEAPPTNPQTIKRDLTFCHDFQNGLCPRNACRFIHCTVGEEDYYLGSGHILPHILEQATIKGQILDATPCGEVPICKDFLMGDCLRKRGGKCRFRHLTKTEYEHEIYGSRKNNNSDNENKSHTCHNSMENGTILPDPKRQRFDPGPQATTEILRDAREREFLRCMDDISRGELLSREISLREFRDRDRELDRERDRRGLEEIILLRKQLETLKKEIMSLKKENSDLRATNDFLLEKLTTLGITKQGGTVTTVTVPTVSLASTIPVATSVRPLMATQVSHPLSITSDCSVGSIVAITPQAQAPPQSMAPPTQQVGVAPQPTAVLGSVGAVQVSLAQASALTAVSLPSVNLNTMASITSMAPSIVPPCSAPNIAQAISMSGASGHLVTYPIMTQPGLRPQMQ